MAASEPTSSLSKAIDNLHPFTLSRFFGTLTIVWVVPLSEAKLTPDSPFPHIYDLQKFGVRQKTDQFPGLNLQSVTLPSIRS